MHPPVTMQLTFGNGGNCNMTDVGHARQRFSSETHRFYGLQVLESRQL